MERKCLPKQFFFILKHSRNNARRELSLLVWEYFSYVVYPWTFDFYNFLELENNSKHALTNNKDWGLEIGFSPPIYNTTVTIWDLGMKPWFINNYEIIREKRKGKKSFFYIFLIGMRYFNERKENYKRRTIKLGTRVILHWKKRKSTKRELQS